MTGKQLSPRKNNNSKQNDGTDPEYETVPLDKAAFVIKVIVIITHGIVTVSAW